MAEMKNRFIQALVAELAHDGEMAIHEAYENRDWNNRTFNLHDSYGSAVYVNRRLVKSSVRYVGNELAKEGLSVGWKWNKPRSMPDYRGERRFTGDEVQMRGREEVMDFFSKYTPQGKGIELVIVAAMYYAGYLEKGAGGLKRKYKVISGAATIMERFKAKYQGELQKFTKTRDIRVMTTIKDKSWA